jgi:hypothetical protein
VHDSNRHRRAPEKHFRPTPIFFRLTFFGVSIGENYSPNPGNFTPKTRWVTVKLVPSADNCPDSAPAPTDIELKRGLRIPQSQPEKKRRPEPFGICLAQTPV